MDARKHRFEPLCSDLDMSAALRLILGIFVAVAAAAVCGSTPVAAQLPPRPERPVFVRVAPRQVGPGGALLVVARSAEPFGNTISVDWANSSSASLRRCRTVVDPGIATVEGHQDCSVGAAYNPIEVDASSREYLSAIRYPEGSLPGEYAVWGAWERPSPGWIQPTVQVVPGAAKMAFRPSELEGGLCDNVRPWIRGNPSDRLVAEKWLSARSKELRDCASARPGFYRVRNGPDILAYVYVPSPDDRADLCAADPYYAACLRWSDGNEPKA